MNPLALTVNGYDLYTQLDEVDGNPVTDLIVYLVMTDGAELEYPMGTADDVDEYLYEFTS